MKEVTATDARRHWSRFIRMVSEGPVRVTRRSKEEAFALSAELYEQMQAAARLRDERSKD